MFAFDLQRMLICTINLAIGELLYRTIQLPFEWRRRRQLICNMAGSNAFGPILSDCLLPVNKRTKLFLAVLCISTAFFCGNATFRTQLLSADSATVIVATTLWRAMGLIPSSAIQQRHHRQQTQTDARIDAVRFICTARGLDYGSGMALSYYHGYLKLMLPTLGDYQSKSIRDRIDDYEDQHHVRFPVKKLFILVPESMYTPNTLDAPTLTTRTSLEKLVLNRAGIPRREYHNAVYRIENTDGWYVAAEGASPLKTFYEALRSANGGAALESYRAEILDSFVQQLRRLLAEDEDCRDLWEVVPFRDRDESGRAVDWGQVLRRAVEDALMRANGGVGL